MSKYIDLSLGDYLQIQSPVSSSSSNWRIEIGAAVPAVSNTWTQVVGYSSDEFLTKIQFRAVSSYFGRDELEVRLNNTTYDIDSANGVTVLADGDIHDWVLTCDGTTLTALLDGDAFGTKACSETISLFDILGDGGNIAGEMPGYLEYVRAYESLDTSALVYNWDANTADSSDTGSQPVIPESIANNYATGVGFPTDGTAFISTADDSLPTLIIDQSVVSPEGVITLTSEMLDATTLVLTDSADTTLTLTLTNNGDGTYEAEPLPSFANMTLLDGELTAVASNSSAELTQEDTITLEFTGWVELTAVEQSSMLDVMDWGYGLNLEVGQTAYISSPDGVTPVNNGLNLIDYEVFTGGTQEFYVRSTDGTTLTQYVLTLSETNGANTAPTVTIQNTSLSVPYGTVWSDSLLGTITTSDDSDTVTYTVDSSAYVANTAGTYEITVTTSADSGGLTGTASAFVTVEAEVVAVAKVTIPKLKNKLGSNVSASGVYKIYSDIALTSLVATGTFSASAGYDVAWDQEELTSGSTYYVLMYDTNGEFSLRKVVAS